MAELKIDGISERRARQLEAFVVIGALAKEAQEALLREVAAANDRLKAADGAGDPVQSELHVEWLYKALDEMHAAVEGTNLAAVAVHDREAQLRAARDGSRKTTSDLLRKPTEEIERALNRDPSGARTSIRKLFDEDAKARTGGRQPFDELFLGSLTPLGQKLDQIEDLLSLIRRPVARPAPPRWTVWGGVVLAVLAVPFWYVWQSSGSGGTPGAAGPVGIVETDIEHLRAILQEGDQSWWRRIAGATKFLWEAVLALPAVLAILATVLAVLRRRGVKLPKALADRAGLLSELTKELNDAMPSRDGGPAISVRFVAGGRHEAKGDNKV